jgi:hypothetical protein
MTMKARALQAACSQKRKNQKKADAHDKSVPALN